MPAKIEFSKRIDNEMKRSASTSEIAHIMEGFTKSTGWDVAGMIRPILKGKADSISVSRDRPSVRLFVRKSFFEPKMSFDLNMGYEKKMKIELPIEDVKKIFKV